MIPLILGFALNCASTFTTFYSRHLGDRSGWLACIILRDVLGIPILTVGYALAAIASSRQLFDPSPLSLVLAWILVIAGAVIICMGIWSLRWRAVAPTMRDTLVSHGLYAYIRHPLYSGMILQLVGLFLWVPTLPISIACFLGVVWVVLQARLEELDLVERIPTYSEYMQRVPPFVPKFRRL